MLRLSLIAVLLAAWLAPALAAEQADAPLQSRQETLELPGLTAGCHVCEWRPKLNRMAAAEQCGTDESGAARHGTFECGFAPDCQRECHFVSCETP